MELKLKSTSTGSPVSPPTNRTIVELKLKKSKERILFNSFYQSYHSGIETLYERSKDNHRDPTTNRTIVELKLERMILLYSNKGELPIVP